MRQGILYTALMLLVALNAPVYAQGLFAPKVDYATGNGPSSVFIADLNGDGDNDLITANEGSRTVSVLLNNGDGTFAGKVDYAAGTAPISVFSADLDGDEDIDLTVANIWSDNVSVLMNNGDGTFAHKVDYATGNSSSNSSSSVFIADLNGDGDNDLITANRALSGNISNVSVLTNNGDGTFAPKVDYTAGDAPSSVFSADLDGDGDNDLVVTNWLNDNVSVLMNNGDGTFASKVDYPTGYRPEAVFSADLDGDGDNDLAVANIAVDNVSVLMNKGDGTFATKVDYFVGHSPTSVFIADLDGDGANDLAVAKGFGGNDVSVLLNNGDGTFGLRINYVVGYSPRSVFIADLDGDGDNDLAVASRGLDYVSDSVSVLLNLSVAPPPAPPVVTSINPTLGVELRSARVTIAGRDFQRGTTVTFGNSTATDVVAVTTQSITATTPALPVGTVDVIVTNPDSQADTLFDRFAFVPPLFGHPTAYPAWGSVFIADLDGDGDNDLVTARVSVLLNNGNGTFAPKVDYAAGFDPYSVFSVDLDGDGDNDLAVANAGSGHQASTLSVLLNNGDGTFAPQVEYGIGASPNSVFGADLDGDGDNDLAVANRGFGPGSVSVLLNNGDGTFADGVYYTAGYSPSAVFGADLDGDGDDDLTVANMYSDNVSVLMNNGDGTFAGKVDYAAGNGPISVLSTDLDGDGDNDLAVANVFSDNISVLFNNGDGSFATNVDYSTDIGPTRDFPTSVFSADLDGDGDSDLAVANRFSNIVSVFLNNGAGQFAARVDYAVGDEPRSVFSADLDGDGDNDLAVGNFSSGNVSVLMNLSDIPITAVTEYEEPSLNVPEAYSLAQNYPNPFNHQTVIHYDLPVQSHVELSVFNLMGHKVATLVDGYRSVGSYSVIWNGKDDNGKSLASGVYLYRLKTEGFGQSKKLVLMK